MWAQNSEPNYPSILFQKQLYQNQKNINNNNIYDEDFVSLINALSESIKEYYKVSRNNITESNTFISFYEQQGNKIQLLIDEISNSNSYDKINELFEQIPKISEIISQLQMNTNSNQKNLDLFFEDAKILFKKMKNKRKQKLIEINNSFRNKNLNSKYNDYSSNIHTLNKIKPNTNNNLNMNKRKSESRQINRIKTNNNINHNNNSNYNYSSISSINNKYSKIMVLINNLNEFNYKLSKISLEDSNKYNTLQNKIKKELETLIKLDNNKSYLENPKLFLNLKYDNDINHTLNKEEKRSKSLPGRANQEIERLKKKNLLNENKIMQLNNQINKYKKNISDISEISKFNVESESIIKDLRIKNNNLNLGLIEAKKEIIDKNNIINEYKKNLSNNNIKIKNNKNNNINLINELKQKDNQVINLQQQLFIYKNNEASLNNQINDLKKKFQKAISNYETQISHLRNRNPPLSKILINKNKEKLNSQNENNINKNEIGQLKNEINNKIITNNSTKYEETIQILQSQIYNYQNKISQYENKIKELSENNNNNNNNNNINNIGINPNINIGNENNEKIIVDLKNKISQLNKEIIGYQRKEIENEDRNNKYIKQIDDMNNNILYTNKFIEQKDELIKQLNENNKNKNYLILKNERDDYKFQYEQMQKKYLNIKGILENNNTNMQQNNIDILKLKLSDMQLENEKLQKEISELKEKNNNQILKGNNIDQNTIKSDNELINKMKELTLENSKIKDLLSKEKEKITKLESEIKKKDDELEGLKIFIFKLQSKIEKSEEKIDKNKKESQSNNILNKLHSAEKKIKNLQDKNKELKYKLEEKQEERDFSGYHTEDNNASNYEEEFDLKKMVLGAREKNRSEDINIDYPGVQGLKEKYKENLRKIVMLEEQVKILISNINCNNKIKPQITQICQIMEIPSNKIQLIIAGKDKKKALGLIS